MKRFFLLSILLLAGLSYAGEIDDPFLEANQHYAASHYQQAVDLYEKILGSGVSSGPLFYNLGNGYFKLGQYGKAILNYERALRLMPQDEDLLANLSFVGTLLEQAQPTENYPWYETLFVTLRDLFSATEWTILLLCVYSSLFFALLLVISGARFRKVALRAAGVFLFLTIASTVFASSKIYVLEKQKEGVIVQKIAEARYSPSLTGGVAFRLHEGIKAQVLRQEGNWIYIRLTRDKAGWVERVAIEVI